MDMTMLDTNCFGPDWPRLLTTALTATVPVALLLGAGWWLRQLRQR